MPVLDNYDQVNLRLWWLNRSENNLENLEYVNNEFQRYRNVDIIDKNVTMYRRKKE